jgi:hypothetical protein
VNFDNLPNKILSLLEKDASVLREKLGYEVKENHDLNGLVEKIVQLFK